MTATTDADVAAPRSVAALLSDRTFGPYFVGNLISNCGSWLQNIAAAVVVYRLTGSNILVATVSILQFASSLVLSPWAGALSDRVDRRRLLMGGQAIALFGAGGLALWTGLVGIEGLPGVWPILVAALLIGVGWAISVPTMQALVPALVGPADLDQAVALNSITFNLARAVGPALGALVLATMGAEGAFGLNTLSFVILIVVLLRIRPREVHRPKAGADGSVRAGLRYVRDEPALLVLLIGVTALGFGTDPVNTLTPAMAERLGGGDAMVGWLVSSFGIGAATTALFVGVLRRYLSLGAMSVVGLAVLAAGLVGFALATSAVVAGASLALSGVGFLLAITGLTTELQQRVDEHMRGRVMALWSMAFLGSRPVAALLDGAVADLTDPRVAAGTAAAITAGVAWWLALARRRRGLDAPVALGSSDEPGAQSPATS